MSDERFKEEPPPPLRAGKRTWRLRYEDVQAFLDKYCAKLGVQRDEKRKRGAPEQPTELATATDQDWEKFRRGE